MNKERETAHVVVDMLNDFIDGTLACHNSHNSVIKSIEYINNNPNQKVLYIEDSHPANHCSFINNGGIWPPHCVSGTKGQEVHQDFFTKIIDSNSRPQKSNTLKKGADSQQEQYSGFEAKSFSGETLGDHLRSLGVNHVVISGIATEYCVFETTKDLLNHGFEVSVLSEALAYVDRKGHKESLERLSTMGAEILH
ncbi:MAG: isochorismatase family protein [Bacteroidales bacterium]|jgi:nicotinamidase-related amidase|nr:isochorismatase family protein [Bacteroidales bacterium]